jgi:hypothetical protein
VHHTSTGRTTQQAAGGGDFGGQTVFGAANLAVGEFGNQLSASLAEQIDTTSHLSQI